MWLEQKVTEWGCMQALIDFEGWRKWRGYANPPGAARPSTVSRNPSALAGPSGVPSQAESGDPDTDTRPGDSGQTGARQSGQPIPTDYAGKNISNTSLNTFPSGERPVMQSSVPPSPLRHATTPTSIARRRMNRNNEAADTNSPRT